MPRFTQAAPRVDCRRVSTPPPPPARAGRCLWGILRRQLARQRIVRYLQLRVAGQPLGREEEKAARRLYLEEYAGKVRSAVDAHEYLAALNIDTTVEIIAAKAPIRCGTARGGIWSFTDLQRILERVKGAVDDGEGDVDLHTAYSEICESKYSMGRDTLRRATIDFDALGPTVWEAFPSRLNVDDFVGYFSEADRADRMAATPLSSVRVRSALTDAVSDAEESQELLLASSATLSTHSCFVNDDDIALEVNGVREDDTELREAARRRRMSHRHALRATAAARQRWQRLAAAVAKGDIVKMLRRQQLVEGTLSSDGIRVALNDVLTAHKARGSGARRRRPASLCPEVLTSDRRRVPSCPPLTAGRSGGGMVFKRMGSFCKTPETALPSPPASREGGSRRGSRRVRSDRFLPVSPVSPARGRNRSPAGSRRISLTLLPPTPPGVELPVPPPQRGKRTSFSTITCTSSGSTTATPDAFPLPASVKRPPRQTFWTPDTGLNTSSGSSNIVSITGTMAVSITVPTKPSEAPVRARAHRRMSHQPPQGGRGRTPRRRASLSTVC